MTPAEGIKLRDMALQYQANQAEFADEQKQRESRGIMLSALREPGAFDAESGAPTPQTVAKISQVDPKMGLDFERQRRMSLAELEKTKRAQLSAAARQASIDAKLGFGEGLQELMKPPEVKEREEKMHAMSRDFTEASLKRYDALVKTGASQDVTQDGWKSAWIEEIDKREKDGSLKQAGYSDEQIQMLKTRVPSPDQARDKMREREEGRMRMLAAQAKSKLISQGYQLDPQNQTQLKFIPGGPKDPDVIRAQAEAKHIPRASKEEGGPKLDTKTADFIAQQVWAGDRQAAVGWARNPQMHAQISEAIRREGERRHSSARDLAGVMAEYEGARAGQRALGTRSANVGVAINELDQFVKIGIAASDKVPRTNFVPINRLMRLGREQWSPDQAAFEASNRSIINAFAQVAARSGNATVHNTQEAEHMLNTAQTPEQYKAVLKQLQTEAQGARRAVGQTRGEITEAVTGKPTRETPESPAPQLKPYSDADKEKRYQEWKKKHGY